MEKLKVVLQRLWENPNQSTGILYIVGESGQPVFASLCIERGDRNNQRNVSNVPPGTYELVLEYSPRFKKDLWELKGVPNRSECKIHASNFWKQLNGCIAPGLKLKDLNRDGYYDVTNSAKTLDSFMVCLKSIRRTTIEIRDPQI